MSRAHIRTQRLLVAILMLAASLAAPSMASAAAQAPDVEHGTFTFTDDDLGVVNICGDLADFHFVITGEYNVVDQGPGLLHVEITQHQTYTVTFLDTALGVWDGRIVQKFVDQSTPGGTFVSQTVANSFEGPTRIHEQLTFVVSADGTVRVDHYKIDVTGCPA